MRVAFIDHYDSFSFNVIDWLVGGDCQIEVDYVAFDDQAKMRQLLDARRPLVLSPGPKRPEDAVSTLELTRKLIGKVPILGICLGHQLLAVASGGTVTQGISPQHGSTRTLSLAPDAGILAGMAHHPLVGVYNSLVVLPHSQGPEWQINAICELGEIQAMTRHVPGQASAFGVQFHPESFLSEGSDVIRRNWLAALTQHSETAPLDMPS